MFEPLWTGFNRLFAVRSGYLGSCHNRQPVAVAVRRNLAEKPDRTGLPDTNFKWFFHFFSGSKCSVGLLKSFISFRVQGRCRASQIIHFFQGLGAVRGSSNLSFLSGSRGTGGPSKISFLSFQLFLSFLSGDICHTFSTVTTPQMWMDAELRLSMGVFKAKTFWLFGKKKDAM